VRLGLTGRILIGGGVVAAIFAIQFVIVIRSFASIRHDTREQQRAEQAVVAASLLEKLVIDLETGARGFVITGDKQFLKPYTAARQSLPRQSGMLMSLAPGPWSSELDRLWRSYVTDYSMPLIRLTEHDPLAARSTMASDQGKQRVDRIRRLIDPFVQRQNDVAVRAGRRVEKAEHAGVVLGGVGSGVRLIVLLAITSCAGW
jgi:CHASE3 domain sensor protein